MRVRPMAHVIHRSKQSSEDQDTQTRHEMIVRPYKRRYGRKRVVFVDPSGDYLDESGATVDPLRLDSADRCFCAWETARRLTVEGRGEALLWNGEHIRWRPRQFPHETE